MAKLYDLSMDPVLHYEKGPDYLTRVGRSHSMLWDVCGECEPDDCTVWCDCCEGGRWFSKAELEAEHAKVEAMDEKGRAAWLEEFTRLHRGQDWHCPPVLPYHRSCTDVLHLWLNVVKVAVRHVFSRPFTGHK